MALTRVQPGRVREPSPVGPPLIDGGQKPMEKRCPLFVVQGGQF